MKNIQHKVHVKHKVQDLRNKIELENDLEKK